MSKKLLVWVIAGVAIVSLGALIVVSKRAQAPLPSPAPLTGTEQRLTELNVTYVLPNDVKTLYGMTVTANTDSGQAVQVHGKACNTMNSTITILAKGAVTDKKVIKTLNDGRQVLEPMTMSTLMACAETTPQTDDAALNAVINNLAASIQSY